MGNRDSIIYQVLFIYIFHLLPFYYGFNVTINKGSMRFETNKRERERKKKKHTFKMFLVMRLDRILPVIASVAIDLANYLHYLMVVRRMVTVRRRRRMVVRRWWRFIMVG